MSVNGYYLDASVSGRLSLFVSLFIRLASLCDFLFMRSRVSKHTRYDSTRFTLCVSVLHLCMCLYLSQTVSVHVSPHATTGHRKSKLFSQPVCSASNRPRVSLASAFAATWCKRSAEGGCLGIAAKPGHGFLARDYGVFRFRFRS